MKVMRKPTLRDSDNAVAPIFGAVLIVLLTFVLAVATVAAVYNDGAIEHINNALTKTPAAVIEIEGIVGCVPNPPQSGGYPDNYIRLVHKSGDPLILDSTFVILSGDGSSYVGIMFNGGYIAYGDVVVKYTDLTQNDKNVLFLQHNPALDDGAWSTGEHLTLWGKDSINGTDASSVLVSVNGISNTSNNYGFDTGTTVTIKIFDKTTQRIVAKGTAIVKPAE